MHQIPLVSVIIPTYNRKELLQRAIKSALLQSYQNIEILVVDDASTDGTVHTVAEMRDERIHYMCLEKNSGPSAARNMGIRQAKGEYIAFLDSDDTWRKDKLEKQLAKMNEGYQAVFCKYLIHDDRCFVMPAEEVFDLEGTEHGLLDILLYQNKIGAPTLMISREAVQSAGDFCEDYYTLEDWEYALRLAEKCWIGYVPEELVDVYLSDGSVSSQRGSKRADVLLSILRQYWNKYQDKSVFDNIIRYLYDDFEIETGASKKALREELFSIIGYNWIADYTFRQTAAIWRQINETNRHLLETNQIIAKHNTAINDMNDVLAGHNQSINDMNDVLAGHNQSINDMNDVLAGHNDAINHINDILSDHNDVINKTNMTISDIVTICDDRTRRIEKLEKLNRKDS